MRVSPYVSLVSETVPFLEYKNKASLSELFSVISKRDLGGILEELKI